MRRGLSVLASILSLLVFFFLVGCGVQEDRMDLARKAAIMYELREAQGYFGGLLTGFTYEEKVAFFLRVMEKHPDHVATVREYGKGGVSWKGDLR